MPINILLHMDMQLLMLHRQLKPSYIAMGEEETALGECGKGAECPYKHEMQVNGLQEFVDVCMHAGYTK